MKPLKPQDRRRRYSGTKNFHRSSNNNKCCSAMATGGWWRTTAFMLCSPSYSRIIYKYHTQVSYKSIIYSNSFFKNSHTTGRPNTFLPSSARRLPHFFVVARAKGVTKHFRPFALLVPQCDHDHGLFSSACQLVICGKSTNQANSTNQIKFANISMSVLHFITPHLPKTVTSITASPWLTMTPPSIASNAMPMAMLGGNDTTSI